MSGLIKTCFALIAMLLLSACVTTGEVKEEKGSPEDAARTYFQLGVEYFKKGKLPLAYEKLERSLGHDDTNAQAHAFFALVAEQLDQDKVAKQHYTTALKLNDQDPVVQNMYGTYLCRSGKVEDAEQFFLKAANNRFYGTPEAAYTNAGSCLLEIEEYDRALDYLNKALRLNANYQLALWYMAKLHYGADRDLQARTFLDRIGDSKVLPPEALLLGYQIAHRSGSRARQQEFSQQLKTRYPESLETTTLLELERNGG